MKTDHDFFLVIDLEATCDDGNVVPKHEMEIIEIGAVLVDARTLDAVEDFQTFVTPVRHPRITPFCTSLTSITQPMLEGAPRFAEAIDALRAFIGDRDALFASWGDYDRKQFEQDARHHRVTLPFRGRHWNIKQAFSESLGEPKRYGMSAALARVGLPLVGTHHRGIYDARNIARLLPWALGRAASPRGASHRAG